MAGGYASAHNLHRSEGGVVERRLDGGPTAYAGELARYIRCPSTIRVRVLERFGRGPSLDDIRALQRKRQVEREEFRRSWEMLGERQGDHAAFTVRRIGTWGFEQPAEPEVVATDVKPLPEPGTYPVLPREIIAAVAAAFGLASGDLAGRSRLRRIVLARRTAIYILRKRGNSYPTIARFLGRWDHSTMIHHVREFEACATPEMREIAARFIGRADPPVFPPPGHRTMAEVMRDERRERDARALRRVRRRVA